MVRYKKAKLSLRHRHRDNHDRHEDENDLVRPHSRLLLISTRISAPTLPFKLTIVQKVYLPSTLFPRLPAFDRSGSTPSSVSTTTQRNSHAHPQAWPWLSLRRPRRPWLQNINSRLVQGSFGHISHRDPRSLTTWVSAKKKPLRRQSEVIPKANSIEMFEIPACRSTQGGPFTRTIKMSHQVF